MKPSRIPVGSLACSWSWGAHEGFQVDPESVPEILQSVHSNPFSDSHGVSSVLSGVSINGLDQVDVETYQSEVTGGSSSTVAQYLRAANAIAYPGAAVVLGFHRQNAPTQHIVATFSATVFSNRSADSLTALIGEMLALFHFSSRSNS